MQDLRIAITGSNGFVGTNLRKFLSNKKIHTISLTRKKYKPYNFEKRLTFSDLDQNGLAAKLTGCNALVHLIGTGTQTVDADYYFVNAEITKKVLKLCKKAKIKKIVYISGLGVNNSTTFGYFISKLKAEKQIINSGLDYTILRASYIIGKNDPLTKSLTKQARRGSILIPGSGKYRLQPIAVSDVSKIILECIASKKLSNKIVDLVGPQTVSFEKFVKRFAKDKKVKVRKIDLEQAYFEALNKPKSALYALDDLNIMIGDFTSNHKRLERLCGFKLKALEWL